MIKFIKGIFLFANLLVVLALLLAGIASKTNPNVWMFPSYFSFFILPLAVLNLFFLLFWLFRKKWWALIPLLSFIFFGGIIKTSFPITIFKPNIETSNKKLTVLSYNTMSTGSMKKEKENEVIKYILDADADIVCLQEFAVSQNESQFTYSDFQKTFSKYPYKHIKYKLEKWNMKLGVVTLSKYPIICKRDVQYNAAFNLSIYSDIVVGADTLRIINNHLESNRITAQDMKQTSRLASDFDSDKIPEITKYLSNKIVVASKVRAVQAQKVVETEKETNYKLIVCGDFNDVPSSYTYTKVKGNLQDAFVETQTGLAWTFNRSFFRYRIDYILYDKQFVPANYKQGNLKDSDHYPIQVDLYFK